MSGPRPPTVRRPKTPPTPGKKKKNITAQFRNTIRRNKTARARGMRKLIGDPVQSAIQAGIVYGPPIARSVVNLTRRGAAASAAVASAYGPPVARSIANWTRRGAVAAARHGYHAASVYGPPIVRGVGQVAYGVGSVAYGAAARAARAAASVAYKAAADAQIAAADAQVAAEAVAENQMPAAPPALFEEKVRRRNHPTIRDLVEASGLSRNQYRQRHPGQYGLFAGNVMRGI